MPMAQAFTKTTVTTMALTTASQVPTHLLLSCTGGAMIVPCAAISMTWSTVSSTGACNASLRLLTSSCFRSGTCFINICDPGPRSCTNPSKLNIVSVNHFSCQSGRPCAKCALAPSITWSTSMAQAVLRLESELLSAITLARALNGTCSASAGRSNMCLKRCRAALLSSDCHRRGGDAVDGDAATSQAARGIMPGMCGTSWLHGAEDSGPQLSWNGSIGGDSTNKERLLGDGTLGTGGAFCGRRMPLTKALSASSSASNRWFSSRNALMAELVAALTH
mmetsp:Transcript_126767/g.366948  ORF Transcript_126767/g.366948 Transcript_126767/m.366948 type:complete len:278 (-) Transcript_126767:130-963(-)